MAKRRRKLADGQLDIWGVAFVEPGPDAKRPKKDVLPVNEHPQPDALGRYLCDVCRESFTANQVGNRWIHAWCLLPWKGRAGPYLAAISRKNEEQ